MCLQNEVGGVSFPDRRIEKFAVLDGPRGRPKRNELERRKTKALEFAASLFVSRGFDDVAIIEIAKVAHVSTRTIAEHLGAKEDIFSASLDLLASRTGKSPPDLSAITSRRHALVLLADYVAQTLESVAFRELCALLVAESDNFQSKVRATYKGLLDEIINNVTYAFEVLEVRGLIKTKSNRFASEIFVDLIGGASGFGLVAPRPINTRCEIGSKVDFLLSSKLFDVDSSELLQ